MTRKHLPKLTSCQNCDTPTPGNFCPECGQDSRDHRVALRLLVVGLWNDLFTFDNRFWRSFVLLLFKPGILTDQFIAGRRVRYIPPARMYLFISLVFFFLMSVMIKAGIREGVGGADMAPAAATAMADSIQTAVTDSLRVPLANGPLVDGHLTEVDSLGSGIIDAVAEDEGLIHGTIFGQDFFLEQESIIGAVINLLPKGMFLLLPLFALLLALVYRRSRRTYVEHLIFSLHFHSFVFILLTVAMLTTWFGSWFIAFVLFYVYLYLAMKRVYGQGWRKTWVKHFLLTNAYNFVFFLFVVIVLAGSVYLAAWAERYPKWLGWAV